MDSIEVRTMDEIKQAELTGALNAFQKAEELSDEGMSLMVLEYAKTLGRKMYIESLSREIAELEKER